MHERVLNSNGQVALMNQKAAKALIPCGAVAESVVAVAFHALSKYERQMPFVVGELGRVPLVNSRFS